MLIQDTIFYRPDWRWHNFLKYLTNNLGKYNCLEKIIPLEYSYKETTYGSKKSKKNVNLFTWGVTHKKRIQFARAVCINSPNYLHDAIYYWHLFRTKLLTNERL